MAEPPVAVGAVQVTADWLFWYEAADTAVGAAGAPTRKELVTEEAMLLPAPLAAVTVKV